MTVQNKHLKLWAVAALVLVLGLAHASVNLRASHAEPAISSSSPQDGAVLSTPPELLNLCFSEPVQTEAEDAWKFAVKPNGSTSLGLRIVFLPDGTCVDVFPGVPDPAPQGIWSFEWSVKAQSDSSDGSGIINFQVGELQPGQTPLPVPESASGGDSTPPVALIALIVAGALIVALGVAGFLLRRRKE
jgi:methionine-rich copper-binding protein CopC